MSPLSAPSLITAQAAAQAADPTRGALSGARERMDRLAGTAEGGPSEAEVARVHQMAEDFEAVFLNQMLAPMFESLETDGMFGGGSGEKMYRGMLVEEYGKSLARTGGVGIADAVARQVLALQEMQT